MGGTVIQFCRIFAVASIPVLALSQAPTGEIVGTLYDTSGAVVTAAAVTATNADTGFQRTTTTNQTGRFSVSSLVGGSYELRVEAAGFRAVVQNAIVATGAVTTVELTLQIGETKDAVAVEAVAPLIDYERHTVDQLVSRQQIEELPLNGRSFLQLAFIEPGVAVSADNQGQYNRAFDVSVLGNDPDRTRITVDGARINDAVDGGTQQNFSQEIVQEFQVSSVNFDLSTGITAGGAINVITRTGSNELHGSGFFYFRDHNMSAYPALRRDPLAPDPFFARRHSGLWVGGPIAKDRLFFFASYEHNNQRGVFSALPSDPSFASFAGVTASPFDEDMVNARLDYRVSARHAAFLRYSHDSNDSFAPRETHSLPSAWVTNTNYADSAVASVSSGVRPTVVNEFRYSTTYWSNHNRPPQEEECPSCVGLAGPHVVVEGTGLVFGNQTNSPQSRLVRRHIVANNTTWQRGSHRIKFGGEWEYLKGTGTYTLYAPAAMTLFSPEEVRQLAPPLAAGLPASFNSASEVLRLPLKNFIFGIGDVSQPPTFQRGEADHDNMIHLYWQDTWRLHPRLTLNYGLAWSFETNALNHDLTKPTLLAPIFGHDGLGQVKHAWLHFSPALGFAWSLPDRRTVIRGGGGIYYDTMNIENRLVERAYLGPLGTGFLPLPGSVVRNPIPGIPGVPVGTPLDFRVPTPFSGAALAAILPAVRTGAEQQFHINPNNTDLRVRNIDVFKTGTDLFTPDFVPAHAQHLNLGVQRLVRNDLAVTADFVYRHFLHQKLRGVDLNQFFAVSGPIIPRCSAESASVPGIPCSNGPIGASISGGRSTYKGLLVRGDKRFSRGFQAQVSYALQDQQGIYGMFDLYTPITNLNNWFQNVGPVLPRHVLNISGIVDLPLGFTVSFISSFTSRAPFQPIISGTDFHGTGVDMFLLPGLGTNKFNFGLGRSDLIRLVDAYNTTYAGRRAPNPAQVFPAVTLPEHFDFGGAFNSQDLRLTKTFRFRESLRWQVFGEIFNAFNVANLRGYANDLLSPAFGQPTARAGNIFGSGGPRAFQVGTRLSF
jgi:hypothetical protein